MRINTSLAFLSLAAGALASRHFSGITVSNYSANGSCRSAADWNNILRTVKSAGFPRIRIYGNDCNAFDLATGAAKAQGLSVLAGISVNSRTIAASAAQIDRDVGAFVNAVAKYGVGVFNGLTIGDEVNDAPINIMRKVWDVRGYLNHIKGIHVPISTVHDWVKIRDNPVLCDADRVTVNAYPFFDSKTSAANAGDFILNTVVPAIKKACARYAAVRTISIAGSGWPSSGPVSGKGVPSIENEATALSSLNCAGRYLGIFAFEADNSYWRDNVHERNFGILDKGLNIPKIFSAC